MLSSLNAVISTNESTEIITGHVIYNPAYTYKFQLKTTHNMLEQCVYAATGKGCLHNLGDVLRSYLQETDTIK